jgi:4-hydroxybenzoate polyprenyltransferase
MAKLTARTILASFGVHEGAWFAPSLLVIKRANSCRYLAGSGQVTTTIGDRRSDWWGSLWWQESGIVQVLLLLAMLLPALLLLLLLLLFIYRRAELEHKGRFHLQPIRVGDQATGLISIVRRWKMS